MCYVGLLCEWTLHPNSFVHISSEFTDDDTPVIPCSCQIHNFIQNVEIEQGSEIAHHACTS